MENIFRTCFFCYLLNLTRIEKLETGYMLSSFVEMICVCAENAREFPVALIVPSKSRIQAFFGKSFEVVSFFVVS